MKRPFALPPARRQRRSEPAPLELVCARRDLPCRSRSTPAYSVLAV